MPFSVANAVCNVCNGTAEILIMKWHYPPPVLIQI